MRLLIKIIPVVCLTITIFSCGKKPQIIPQYTVSKVFKSDSVTTVDVHIANRMPASQLLLIAGKLRKDSISIQNLKVCYLLPGNTDISAGDNSYYASAKYIKESELTAADTMKDDDGKIVRLKMFGLNHAQAKHLLSLQPKEIIGKQVLGRFVDDYNHTLIIPFKDASDKKNVLYVIEVDSAAKVVSATMPLRAEEGGVEKWLVTQNGDYITLKDSVLTQYGVNGLGVPFNSIKSGI